MNKCEWKDGKFEPCTSGYENYIDLGKPYFGNHLKRGHIVKYCPFCGADIRKPEPEKPLIVKSGGTVAVYWQDKNYLCMMPFIDWRLKDYELHFQNNMYDPTRYKLFSLIEKEGLTDNIALLRPMVMVRNHINNSQFLIKLIYVKPSGIDDEYKFVTIEGHWGFCRLATAQELQEAK